ncbi:MAG TPA: hypothetical protein VHG08_27435 [Longimicrobium sp.]|nr:hypothetical protein [Longimicrobium sp.]
MELIAKRDVDLTPAERDLVSAWRDDCFGDQAWTGGYSWAPPSGACSCWMAERPSAT